MDLINRQAAIDVIIEDKICDNTLKIMTALGDGDKAETLNMTCDRHAKMLMSLPPAQSKQRWVPVSERLPEENDYKSCIECLNGAVWYFTKNGTMGMGHYYKSTKEWLTINNLKTDGKVVAWMSLPEPYQRKGE